MITRLVNVSFCNKILPLSTKRFNAFETLGTDQFLRITFLHLTIISLPSYVAVSARSITTGLEPSIYDNPSPPGAPIQSTFLLFVYT